MEGEGLRAESVPMDSVPSSGTTLISVIVAVYRVPEKMLTACLSSLADVCSADVEFLLMDDASPDRCGSICDGWAAHDHRFVTHHVRHGGLSWVRNVGVERARGDYVIFVDGDDRIRPGFLDRLVSILPLEGADLVYYPHLRLPQDLGRRHGCVDTGKLLPGPDPFEAACAITCWNDRRALGPMRDRRISLATAWGKVFRRSFLMDNGCTSPVGVHMGQDRSFMLEVLSHEPRSMILDVTGYEYVSNPSSVTRRYDPEIEQVVSHSERRFVETIRRCYQGERQARLVELTSYQRFRYFITICHRDFFDFGANPTAGHQLAGFKAVCADRADDFSRCRLALIEGSWRWRLMLVLLKLRWYGLLYYLSVTYHWIRWTGDSLRDRPPW